MNFLHGRLADSLLRKTKNKKKTTCFRCAPVSSAVAANVLLQICCSPFDSEERQLFLGTDAGIIRKISGYRKFSQQKLINYVSLLSHSSHFTSFSSAVQVFDAPRCGPERSIVEKTQVPWPPSLTPAQPRILNEP